MTSAISFHAHKPKRKRKARELGLHKFTAQYLRLAALPDVLWFHVPNGEARSAATGAKLKAMGVLAGVADFVIIYRGNVLFLELKSEGKGRLSKAQKAFKERALTAWATYVQADSPDAVRTILRPMTAESMRIGRVAIAPAEAA